MTICETLLQVVMSFLVEFDLQILSQSIQLQ